MFVDMMCTTPLVVREYTFSADSTISVAEADLPKSRDFQGCEGDHFPIKQVNVTC